MNEKPLEIIVIYCSECRVETKHNWKNTRYTSSTVYGNSKEAISFEKPIHTYSCGTCKSIYEFLEKRDQDYNKLEERRKNR